MTTDARARRPGPSVRTRVTEHLADGSRHHEDRLATEEPLEIRLAVPGLPARRVWVTMRTPGHDFELAAGFAVSESLCPLGAIRQVAYCTDVDLGPGAGVQRRHHHGGSGHRHRHGPPARGAQRGVVGLRRLRQGQRGRGARRRARGQVDR